MAVVTSDTSREEGLVDGLGAYLKSRIVDKLELFFYHYGCAVGNHPWKFIIGSILLTVLFCLGLFRFHQEKHPLKLWIPPDSDFAHNTEWLMSEFGEGYRVQYVLLTADDVLQPSVLLKLLDIRQKVVRSELNNITISDVCFRIPVVDVNTRLRRGINDLFGGEGGLFGAFDVPSSEFDPTVHLSTGMFCKIVESFPTACFERSILEFWNYDRDRIKKLTKADIIEALNTTDVSPVYGLPMEYKSLIGGAERDESGSIVKGKALLSLWMVHVNFSAVNMDEVGNNGGTNDWATVQGMTWEKSFLNTMEELSTRKMFGVKLYYEAGRSFGDISNDIMFQDIDKVMMGVFLMFLYVLFVLSKCSWLHIKIIPASGGLACVGLAFISACGICSALGISYGPVHTSLPFLLMGIGVDDMFVIMACKNNLSNEEKKHSLPTQIGLALRRAGVSICITSFTDIVATSIGGTTVLPALESFCYFASVGVFITFIYQSTFFLAFVVLDEQRLASSGNPFIPCLRCDDSQDLTNLKKDNNVHSKGFLHFLFSKVILTIPGKILIILITIGMMCVGIEGVMNLKQKFDPKWFLPEDSYLVKFLNQREKWYPDMGQDAGIYFGKLNYSSDLNNICALANHLQSEKSIISELDNWCDEFFHYVNFYYKRDVPNEILSEQELRMFIGKYLFSPSGAKYNKNFRFADKLECGKLAPPITVASFDLKFKLFSGPEEALPAMNYVKDLLKNSNITSGDGFKAIWGKIFAHWVTDEIIQGELYRNLTLACICVMATTTVLILNIHLCFWIFMAVLLTLINVCGTMYFWGLTIDIVSCIALVIAVGLCVDYAAHVGHTFLKCHGSRNERILETIESVGSAVINGGISTLIALSMLSISQSYTFQSFFKIFFLVVVYGLFHGVIFLPVVLSFIGPAAHETMPVLHTSGKFIKSKQCDLELIDS
ncbi:patched domain-containing protein 3-like [Lycorma delicatula]|uniref:patched domain-containing protein 3-like n=1 Tax=Lycorma delicatula TaxID=130591 RepID=UPI003F51A28D